MSSPAASLAPWVLFTVMLALAVGLPSHAWRDWHNHRGLLLRIELSSCLLVPLVGLLLLCLPGARQLSSDARHALALMAVCPSAPLILRKAARAGGDASLASLLQIGAALVAIVSVPLLAQLGQWIFAVGDWDIQPRLVAQQVLQMQLLPLLLGFGLRRLAPRLCQRIQGPLDTIANALLLLLVLAVLVKAGPLLLRFVQDNGTALVVMGMLVVISLVIGSMAAGGDRSQRTTAALVTSMRNPGLALLLASNHAADQPMIKLGILIYVLLTVALSAPVLRWQQSRLR
jgi:BASS family bile acid:Na+ symporter